MQVPAMGGPGAGGMGGGMGFGIGKVHNISLLLYRIAKELFISLLINKENPKRWKNHQRWR